MYSTRSSSRILMNLEFSRDFRKIKKLLGFMKINPVAAELFHANEQT